MSSTSVQLLKYTWFFSWNSGIAVRTSGVIWFGLVFFLHKLTPLKFCTHWSISKTTNKHVNNAIIIWSYGEKNSHVRTVLIIHRQYAFCIFFFKNKLFPERWISLSWDGMLICSGSRLQVSPLVGPEGISLLLWMLLKAARKERKKKHKRNQYFS